MTDASTAATAAYRDEMRLAFPILAEAATTREAWGVEMIWGNVVRLVAPDGRVVAEGLDDAAAELARR